MGVCEGRNRREKERAREKRGKEIVLEVSYAPLTKLRQPA